MIISLTLIFNSVLLGVGLAMDAFSVSLANGLNEHKMGVGRMLAIAGTFAGFQFAMPVIGWFCVHKLAEAFNAFQKYIPWIALGLLLYIGGKMLIEGIGDVRSEREAKGSASDTLEDGVNAINEEGRLKQHMGNDNSEVPGAAKPEAYQTVKKVALGELMMQGVATSIDALSVGFTIADYNAAMALIASLIIGVVTYIICMAGLALGKKFGTRLAGKATILGGVILIGIGVEIWISGVFL